MSFIWDKSREQSAINHALATFLTFLWFINFAMGKLSRTEPATDLWSEEAEVSPGRVGDEPGRRKCLMCARSFDSEGTHNRICRRCKASQTYRSG